MRNHGDVCSCCRNPFGSPESTFGGITHDRKVMLFGPCCVKQLKSIHNAGIYVSGNTAKALGDAAISFDTLIETPWKTADAAWFRENPDRTHRARPPIAGERLPAELGPAP